MDSGPPGEPGADPLNLRVGGVDLLLGFNVARLAEYFSGRFAGFLDGSADGIPCHLDESAAPAAYAGRPSGGVCAPQPPTAFQSCGEKLVIRRRGLSGYFDLASLEARGRLDGTDDTGAEAFIRFSAVTAMAKRATLAFHGSGVCVGERSALFLAPPGGGKSTVARLSGERPVLSDEINIVRRADDGFRMAGSPFQSTNPEMNNMERPLGAIFFLSKSSEVGVELIPPQHATARIAHSVINFRFPSPLTSGLFRQACLLASDVPAYVLSFRKDPDFWRVVENVCT
ncbi:hypothetical protein ACFL2T_03050 [Elusimicrobiota bacterium]